MGFLTDIAKIAIGTAIGSSAITRKKRKQNSAYERTGRT